MIAKAVILFLFGTSLTSGQFFSHSAQYALRAPARSTGCPSGPELAPLICKFMLVNMDLEFKPQLIEPTTYIAPLVVQKCDSPQIEMDIELPAPAPLEEVKPLVIPAPPELPPMTIPKFPVPVIIEEPPMPHDGFVNIPAALKLPPFEEHELPQISTGPEPCLNEEVIPDINENTIEYLPHEMTIPQPPELPSFVMPEIPVLAAELEPPMPAAPYLEDKPISVPTPFVPCEQDELIAAHVEPLAPLPAAPQLPEFTMPMLPVYMEPLPTAPCPEDDPIPAPIPVYIEPIAPLPAGPELPMFTMPELPSHVGTVAAAPCEEDEPIPSPIPVYVEPLAPLPAAPELPAFTMPELPTLVVAQEFPMPAAPCLEDEPIAAPTPIYIEPLAPLPAAPELPAFTMPELPIPEVQELPMPVAPCLEDEPIPAPTPMYIEPLAPLPAAPELPAFTMPELPIPVVQELPMPVAPCLEDAPIPAPIPIYIEPLAPLPAAQESPAYTMPEHHVIEPESPKPAAPCLDEPIPYIQIPADQPMPEYIYQPIAMPQLPELPEIKTPELPAKVALEEPTPCGPSFVMPSTFYKKLFPSHFNDKEDTLNILLPSQPMKPGVYPTPCVYNLVMNHVVPNMFSNNFQPVSILPCS